MRILTFVSPAVDSEETVRVRNGVVDLSTTKLAIDTMDKYGVEESLRIRDRGLDVEIVAVGVGHDGVAQSIRAALDMGVDRAIHVVTTGETDVLTVGALLAKVAHMEAADLIFLGGQQANWDSQALCGAVAEQLGWPQVTWVKELDIRGTVLTGSHDVDAGSETFEVELPAVISTQQGLNEPRYPTVPNIRKSAKKEVRQEAADRFGVDVRVQTLSAQLHSSQRLQPIIDGKDAVVAAAQIVDFLRNEAKVIP
jgi:electron transfer flavoprotein beta subunit